MVRQKRKTMKWLFSILLCISQMNIPARAEDELLPAEEEEQVILENELQEEEEPAVVITESPEAEAVQEEPSAEEPKEENLPEESTEEMPAEELSDPDVAQEGQTQDTEELPAEDLPEETVTEEPAEPESFESVYVDASEYMLQAGAILKEEEEYSEAYATTASFDLRTDFAALNAVFQRGVSQWETSVNVASFNIPTSEASKVYGYLTNANPQFFYLSNRFRYSYNSSNCIVSLNLEYDTAYTRTDSETFENRVNEITAGVDASWSDTQKALYLHDVLVIDNTYDLTYSNYNAYNALIDRTSVCQGYSLAYKYLLNKVGIESDIISCESFNHAWNTVVVDGTTYFVDSTWDDPIKTYRMRCKHTNFLRDRDGLLDTGHIKDDGTDAKDWVNSFGENIYNSYLTDYPNAYWANCITQIPHIGNSWFYPDSSGNIFRFNGNTGSTSVLTTLSDYWYTIDQSGYWGRYIHLDVFEDKLVASQEGSVYLIDMSGNLTSVGTLTDAEYNSARIYGIQTQGNKVRYDLYESPNASQLYNFGYFVLKEVIPVTSITLNIPALSFTSIGSTSTLTATVLPANATDKSVSWQSSNTNVVTVDNAGKVTAVGSGTAVITAVSSDPSITAQCSVTVTIAVQSVSVSPETAQMFTGEKLQLQAAVLPSAASDKTVTWKSSNTAVATVDSTGKVTAVSNGTAVITATTGDGGYTDTCTVSVSTPLFEVHLNTDSLSLTKGETAYLTVSFVPETASDHTVAWSSSDPSIAAVDSTGKITAVSNGTAVITVTANDGGFTDTCTVTVTTPLNGIALNKHTLSLNKNSSETLTVSFDPEDASDQTVVWSSSDPSAVSVDQNGTVTALKGGSAVITVVSSDGSHSDTCTVTVTVPVTGITLSQNTLSLNKGDTYQLVSNVQPSDATDKTVTWQSSDTAVAAVDNTGKVTAVSNGTAAITATSNDGGYTDTCTVTVTTPLTGITLNTHAITLEKTKSQTLLVAFSPEDASNKNVTWSSSDPQIASVSSSGTVTARGAGTAVITVVSQYGSYSDSCTVTVTSPLRGIHPDVHELQLSKGESYTVTVMYDPEDTTDDRTLRWISQDTTVAKVDSNGTITGVGAGFTKVTVSLKSGRFANTINVFVNIPAEGIELSEHELTMNKCTSQSVQAEFYPQGAETQNVIWSSSDESVVTVDADGTFNAVGKGTAVVTVTSEDGAFTDTCSVTVRVPVEEIYITGSGTELKVGQTMSLSLTILPEDADRENIFWFSLNPEIASVDQNGTVTGISEGETVIGVKAVADQIQVDVGIRVVPDVVSVTGIMLSEHALTLETGGSGQLSAYVTPENASNKKVYWTSADPSVATVDEQGTIRAVGDGQTTITVATEDGGYTDTCTVTVNEYEKKIRLNETSLTLTAPPEIFDLDAFIGDDELSPAEVIWTSSDQYSVSVDENGTLRAIWGGTVYITATLVSDETVSATCEVTVDSNMSVVRETENAHILNPGEEYDLKARFIPEYGAAETIEWQTSDPSVAEVDNNGHVTALSSGTAVVSVSLKKDGHIYRRDCEIYVIGSGYRPVSQINLNLMNYTDVAWTGSMDWYTAYVYPDNASVKAVNWKSSDYSVADVDPDGYVYFKDPGVAFVWCEGADGIVYQERRIVSLPEGSVFVEGFEFDTHELTVGTGRSVQLPYHFTPSNATNQNLEWTVDDEDIVEVQQDGTIIGLREGTTYVHALTEAGDYTDSCRITVADTVPAEPVISDSEITLNAYGKHQLTVYSWDTEYVIDRIEWESDDTYVAEVDENGLITAIAGGSTLIRGHVFIGSEEFEVTCSVHVNGDPYTPVSELKLTAEQLILLIGDSYHLSVQYFPENASRKKVIWSSDNEEAATVDENGNVTAVGTGTAMIRASSPDGVYAECPVTAGWWITSITLEETEITLTNGDTYQIVWTILPAEAADHKLIFTTNRPDVLTIDENGLITTTGVGPAIVTVESADPERPASAYLNVYVQEKHPDNIPVTSMSLNVGSSYGFSEVGSSSGFTAYCWPQDATDQTVTWFSSDDSVVTVDEDGVVMAMGAGEADITATCRDGVSVTCHVTVDASEEGKHVIGDYIYYLTDSEASLIGYINKPSDIVIPAYVNDLPVTSIGKSVFENHTEIETVTLPDTMLRIGSYAFMGCSNLNSISFGNSLQEIGPGAFLDCGSLTSISLPASMSRENDIDWEYSEGPFSNCWNLREVTFGQEDSGSSFWMIPDGLFRDCSGLVEITLPKSVISIGTYAFAHCVNLTTIHLPENMERIGRGAFEWCENLERLDGLNYLYEAGPYAFSMCYQLKEAEFAASLSHLADGLFRNCESLTSITLSSQVLNEDDSYGMSPFDGDYHLEEVNILQDVIPEYGAVPAGLFRGCTGLRFFEIPSFVRKIRNNAFEDTGLQSIVIPDSVEEIEEYAFRNCRDLVNVTLSKNLKTLPSGLFSGCTSLEEIELPASLSGNEADGSPYEGPFSYCSSLKTVTFAEGFKVIPGKLFKDCTGLRQIHIPESVTHIGENTFENTQLTDVWMTCFLEKVGDHAFDLSETAAHGLHVHYTGTPEQWRNLTIGINNEPLTYNEPDYSVPIESITFDPSEYVIYSGIVYEFIPVIKPETYSSIQLVWSSSDNEIASVDETGHIIAKAQGEAIITASLGSVSGSLKVTVAERVHFDYIWNDDDSITITKFSGTEEHLIIPMEIAGHPVTQIGEGAFKDNLMLRSVELPYTVKEIGTEAFAGCTALEAVNLSSGVTKIGDRAFYGCSSLDYVVMPDTVTVMGEQVFACCEGLTDIHLSESLTEIPAQSFYNCTSLAEIVIPDHVTVIGEQAFEGCSLLERAVLPASLTTVETGAFNEVPEEITVEYNGRRYLWEQIDFSEGNEIIQTAEVICHPAEEDKIPAETPVIRYQDDYGVLNKATGETTVKEGTVVSLISAGEGELRYTLDGSDPVSNGIPYTSEIVLKFEYGSRIIVKTAVVPSEDSEYRSSSVAEAVFLRKENTWQGDPGDVTRPDAEEVSEVIPEGIWVTGTDQEFVYNGKAQTFGNLKVYDGNKLLKKNTDYTVKYTDNLHTYGTPLLTITGKGNYTETIGIPFVIRQADLAEAAASDLSVTYTAALKGPSPFVSYNGLKLKEGTDYVVENRPFTSELEAGGIFELILTGINDFYGTRTVMMYVSPEAVRTVAVSKVSSSKIAPVPFVKGQKVDPASLTTTGGAPLSFKYSKKELNEDQYTLSVTNDEKPGTAYLVICGTGIPDESGTAFTGTKKISFKISGPAIQTSIRAAETVFPYDGLTKSLVLLDNETDEVLTEGTDYTITWNKKPVNAGKYTAAIKGITYTGSMKLAVTVTPVTENITYSYSSQYVKGGNPAVTVRCGGLLLKKGADYTVTYGKLAGLTQTLTIRMKGNYSGTFSETATFDPKDLSEVTMSVKDSAYSSKAGKNYVQPVLTDTNGKVLKAGTDYEKPVSGSEAYTYVKDTQVTVGTGTKAVKEYRAAGEAVRKTDIIPAGTMIRVTAKAKGNYTGSISAVYMVISAVNRLTGAKVTVKETYEYTGKAIVPSVNDIEVILKDGTVLSPEDFEIISVSGNIKPTKKAKVTVRGVNGRGYGGTASGLFTIVRQAMELTAEETENTYNH